MKLNFKKPFGAADTHIAYIREYPPPLGADST